MVIDSVDILRFSVDLDCVSVEVNIMRNELFFCFETALKLI